MNRRDILRAGAISALALATPGRLRAAAPPPEMSCILVWLRGGLSHIDSFDPKPDAPSEIRGAFSPIATRVPGLSICEHLPRLAAIADKFSIVRSLDPGNGTHGLSEASMLSGHPYQSSITFPGFGAVAARVWASDVAFPHVQLGRDLDGRFGGGGAGFLGENYRPTVLAADPSAPELLARGPGSGEGRERYGPGPLGHRCFLAGRLIESGTRFVTVTDGGWDTHRDGFRTLADRLPRLDAAISALIRDLDERGRLASTVVAVLSDFGRTPKTNAEAGRDHCATAGIALLAGGGVRGGVTVGRTDAIGERAVEAPYAPADLAATLYDRLGIPGDLVHIMADGQSIALHAGGRLIRELL